MRQDWTWLNGCYTSAKGILNLVLQFLAVLCIATHRIVETLAPLEVLPLLPQNFLHHLGNALIYARGLADCTNMYTNVYIIGFNVNCTCSL